MAGKIPDEYTHIILYNNIVMQTVIDTSTLISLARISYLEIIRRLKMELVIPEEVYEEAVVAREKKGIADATVIKAFIDHHKLKVVNVKGNEIKRLRRKIGKYLAKGDEAVLSLAIKEKAEEIITNDDGLSKIALALGYRVIASPDLLMRGLKNNILSFKEFETFMRGLVIENRLSSPVAELYLMEGKKHVEG